MFSLDFFSLFPPIMCFCPMCSTDAHIAHLGERHTTHRALSHESGPPSYCSMYKRVRDTMPSRGENLWAVKQSSLRNDNFFGSSVLFKFREFEEHSLFVEIKPHMHMLRVYGHRRWRWPPRQAPLHMLRVYGTDVDSDPPVKLPLRFLHVYTQITKFDTTR